MHWGNGGAFRMVNFAQSADSERATLCYIICAFEPDDEISSDSARQVCPCSCFTFQNPDADFFVCASERVNGRTRATDGRVDDSAGGTREREWGRSVAWQSSSDS